MQGRVKMYMQRFNEEEAKEKAEKSRQQRGDQFVTVQDGNASNSMLKALDNSPNSPARRKSDNNRGSIASRTSKLNQTL